tara:strand:+ start:331 stop:768 length:438 start_codon:yes stop_codon:yes gene_type:complete
MINKIKIHLEKRFITKPLAADTLIKIVAGEHPSVMHRLYLITNALKELQYFMELDHPVYQCTAKIKTEFVYAGDALNQASVFSFMKPYLGRITKYNVIFNVYKKVNIEEVFKFRYTTTNEVDLINMINTLEQKAYEICQDKVNTY